jgi:DNA-directed RNA polymerase specialized sigma24 family protein
VRRYQRLIYSIPRRAGLSDAHAAEVFQHVWFTLAAQLDQAEQQESLGDWLAAVARRESLRQSFLAREKTLPD